MGTDHLPNVKDVILRDRCYHPVLILVGVPIEIRNFVRVATMDELHKEQTSKSILLLQVR